MIGVLVFPLCLLLPRVGGSEFPDFDDAGEYDWYDQHYVCEGDACAWSRSYLYFYEDQAVPNKTVTFEEYEYFDVDTVGLLADCAPSLSVGDIASTMKSCKDEDWKYQGACMYRKKGWLNQDGKTVNKSLGTDFVVIEGVSENIMKCLDWDGVDDYEYYDDFDYDYYDYDYMEESDDVKERAKRDQKSDVPEFMIQKSRKKRSVDKKAINQKGENTIGKKGGNKKGKHGRKSRKKGKKSGKNGNKQGQRGKPLRKHGRKSVRKGRKLGKVVRKSVGERGKGRRKSEKKKHNTVKKANKKKNKTHNRKKNGDKKKNENKKKKEERKKKKKEIKLLKQLGLDSMPSKEILNKLFCVDMAIEYGLEKCGEKIFQNLDLP